MSYKFHENADGSFVVTYSDQPSFHVEIPGWSWTAGALRQLLAENEKLSKLKPVGEIAFNGNQFFLITEDGKPFDMSRHVGTIYMEAK